MGMHASGYSHARAGRNCRRINTLEKSAKMIQRPPESFRWKARELYSTWTVPIDLSTQSFTVEVRVADSFAVLGRALATLPTTHPPLSEQHTDDWWSVSTEASARLKGDGVDVTNRRSPLGQPACRHWARSPEKKWRTSAKGCVPQPRARPCHDDSVTVARNPAPTAKRPGFSLLRGREASSLLTVPP